MPEGFSVITEGAASILRQATESFYNPVQVINRDTSIAVLRRYLQVLKQEQSGKQGRSGKRGVRKAGHKGRCTVFEAMAASGLRSIRYAKEVCVQCVSWQPCWFRQSGNAALACAAALQQHTLCT